MPYPNYPYPYTYHNPSKKEQLALGIGSLLSGLAAASTGDNTGDAVGRGIAGLVGGYGSGWGQYQNQMGDAFNRYMAEQNYNRMLGNDKIENQYMQAITENMRRPRLAPEKPKMSLREQQDKSVESRMKKTELDIKKEQLNKMRIPEQPSSDSDILKKHQVAGIAHGLRGEMRLNPYVKDFQDVNQKYNVMLEALDESKQSGNLIAADQALITLFNKMTDPQSVVRESEYARTPSDQSMLNKIAGKASKVMTGGAGLMPDEREALVRMAGRFYGIYSKNYEDTIGNYSRLATESGINPELVNIPFAMPKQAEKPSPPQVKLEKVGNYLYDPTTGDYYKP